MTRFAIVSMGRTGSTLLVSLLNSHPDIECQGELFGPGAEYSKHPGLTRRQYLEHEAFRSDLPIKGFKMPFDWILEHPGIFEDFRQLGYRIVRLNRTNVLAHLVSIRLAQLNNDWSSRNPYTVEKAAVTPSELWEFLGSRNVTNAILDRFSSQLETARFDYETILASASQQRLLSFLGARSHPLTASTMRQRHKPLSETIEGFAELRQGLSGTDLAPFLDG